MLRAGVAGVGNLGKVHVSSLLSMPALVSVDALADPIAEKSSGKDLKTKGLNLNIGQDEASSTGEVRSYDDFKPLCKDKDLDLVFIATPSDLHASAAVLALENGKHVFTEKPMALQLQDCRRMIDAAKASDRTLMVGHCLRFFPNYVAAAEIMQSGKYGNVLAATLNRHGRRPGGWFAEMERSGGVALDLHIHDVDTALWWWGRPDQVISRMNRNAAGYAVTLSQWRYNDGPEVQLAASWDSGSGFNASFHIILERATLISQGGQLKVFSPDGGTEVDLSGRVAGHRAELIYFIESLIAGSAVDRCLPEDSALAVQYAQGGGSD